MSIVSVNTYYMYLKEMVLVKFFRNQFNNTVYTYDMSWYQPTKKIDLCI